MQDFPLRTSASSPPYADLLDLDGGHVILRFTEDETLVIAPSRVIRRPAACRMLIQLYRLRLRAVPAEHAPVHAELWIDREQEQPVRIRFDGLDGIQPEVDGTALWTEHGYAL